MVLVNDSGTGNDNNGVGVENHHQDCDSKKSSDHLVNVVKKQKSGTKEERPTAVVSYLLTICLNKTKKIQSTALLLDILFEKILTFNILQIALFCGC